MSLLSIVLLAVGILILLTGVLYAKSFHTRHFSTMYSSSAFPSNSTDNFLGALLTFVFGVVLGLLPWYVVKLLLAVIGIALIVIAFQV